ncbi:uncharacterized protein BX664DRAFT_341702 [Halteromyces radiatus]|uniref:uncharacterized protein n=1 Tax=Halteromyces radiatus TaxID=101107 RepID=UPI00221EA10D|nr:uncharacterized protein BX664DRAFT_341702 [Halteromyces radiatus]KAI8079885.1 hypothetical protein BX664DRAFT_341702 [Halteromyces radiatus]
MLDDSISQEQLVYRIDCDKHFTSNGAPPILVLQKDSVKPPILILQGIQTHPSLTPVIRDERKNKSQGYILQDERKPSLSTTITTAVTTPYLSSVQTETSYPYPTTTNDQFLYPPQSFPIDSSQDFSSFGQHSSGLAYSDTIPPSSWSYNNPNNSTFTSPSFGHNPYDGIYGTSADIDTRHSSYGYTQSEPFHWQPAYYQRDQWNQPYDDEYRNERMMYDGSYMTGRNGYMEEERRMMMMMPNYNQQQQQPMPYPSSSSSWQHYHNNIDDGEMRSYMDWNNHGYNSLYYQQQQYPESMVTSRRQPAFRIVNGPRRSKSVSFAPLPGQN